MSSAGLFQLAHKIQLPWLNWLVQFINFLLLQLLTHAIKFINVVDYSGPFSLSTPLAALSGPTLPSTAKAYLIFPTCSGALFPLVALVHLLL